MDRPPCTYRADKRSRVVIDILCVLAETPAASAIQLAKRTARNESAIRMRLDDLIESQLVEKAGREERKPGHIRGQTAALYRLHPRLRRQVAE